MLNDTDKTVILECSYELYDANISDVTINLSGKSFISMQEFSYDFYAAEMPNVILNISDTPFIPTQLPNEEIMKILYLSDNGKMEHERLRGTGTFGVSKYLVRIIDLVSSDDDENSHIVDDDDNRSHIVERPSELSLPVMQPFQPFLTPFTMAVRQWIY